MNTGVGSLSLLQGIFLTQESNRGLLHCRLILYLVSYQEAHLATYLSICLPISLSICCCCYLSIYKWYGKEEGPYFEFSDLES